MHKLARTVAFLKYKGILQQLTILLNHIYIRIVSNPTWEFPKLSFFPDQVFTNLLKGTTDEFKTEEFELGWIGFQERDVLAQFVQVVQNVSDFCDDILLFLFAIFQVTQCLLFKVPIEEQTLHLLKLILQVVEFLIIVFFYARYFFSNISELIDLVFYFILELRDLVLQVVHF